MALTKEQQELKDELEREAHARIAAQATAGGTRSASHKAEERAKKKKGLDISVDPKGYPNKYGPIRLCLGRYREADGLFVLPNGTPMPVETDFDTSGSFGDNIDFTLKSLPHLYESLTGSGGPLNRYDLQMAHGNFNDVEDYVIVDNNLPPICWSQYEAGEKISLQLTSLFPARDGCGNHKEESQLLLFGAAFLTKLRIWDYGLFGYHFVMTDEPCPEIIDAGLLRKTFGDDVFQRVRETGYSFDEKSVPDTAETVKELIKRRHAFALIEPNHPRDCFLVRNLWPRLYGPERVVFLPHGAENIHLLETLIIALTEGTLDLLTAEEFLCQKGLNKVWAQQFVKAVAHIPIGAQKLRPNFDKIPPKGSVFRNKTDLWPIPPDELAALQGAVKDEKKTKRAGKRTKWKL